MKFLVGAQLPRRMARVADVDAGGVLVLHGQRRQLGAGFLCANDDRLDDDLKAELPLKGIGTVAAQAEE